MVGMLVPQGAWAHYVLVGDNRYELSEISLGGSPGLTATIELNKGDEIEIYFCDMLVTRICPEGNNTLTNTGLSCDINYNWPGSITVADAGNYKLTFSEFNYTEEWVMYDENDPGTYEVAFAQAHLTIMPLDNHVHSYTEEITSEESQKIYPTCTAPGVYYKSCVCGDVSTSEDDTFEIPARGHNFIADHDRIVSAATCTKNAYYVGVCSRCQEESNVQDYGSKLGHNWHAAADGVHHTCQRCETQEEHTFDSHTVSESTLISEATCTSAALYHLSCRYCDAISQDNENIFTVGNPLPHTWGDDDKCTMCHNDFNETGDYMNAQVCISGNESLSFSKEDMGANGKKVHIPERASISVSLNYYYVYPESDLFIEETSSAVNLSFKETDYYNISIQNEGDYIINIRRPYFYIEYIQDEDRYETHASCILCIEHVHAYEVTSCEWPEDESAATATMTLTCACEETLTLEAAITTEDTTPATCTTAGVRTYTATVTYKGETYTCSKPGTIPAINHSFANEKLTAEPDEHGLYAYVCDVCEEHGDYNVVKASENEGATTIELTSSTVDGTTTYTATEAVAVPDGAFSTPVDFTATGGQVSIDRTFTTGTPATINLPFDVPASAMSETYYTFGGIAYNSETGKWVATMTEATGTLTANTPYIVLPEHATSINIDNAATVSFKANASTNSTTTNGDWTMKAAKTAKTWDDGDEEIGKAYGFAAQAQAEGNITAGQFVKVGAGASIAAGRAYLEFTGETLPTRANAQLPASIDVIFKAMGTTGIGTLNTETGEFTFDGWYDLQGCPVNNPQKGSVFMNNNHKIIVK